MLAMVLATAPLAGAQELIYEWAGDASGDKFGRSVACAGDVDGDGFEDIIVGGPTNTLNGTSAGMFRVFSGQTGLTLHEGYGTERFGGLGWAVAGVGDLDGDLRSDYLVCAPSNDSVVFRGGIVFLYSGRTGAPLRQHFGTVEHVGLGKSAVSLGDLNGDLRSEYLIGGVQHVKVYSGVDGAELVHIDGSDSGRFGWDVGAAGDVNGDGKPDFIVGDYRFGPTGAAWVFSGLDFSVLHIVAGDSFGEDFGYSVDGAGDVNADGYDDFAIGAPSWEDGVLPRLGRAFVYSGLDGSLLYEHRGSFGYSKLGISVTAAGDANGDGYDDYLVGEPGWRGGCSPEPCRATWLYSGQNGQPLYHFAGSIGGLSTTDMHAAHIRYGVGGTENAWLVGGVIDNNTAALYRANDLYLDSDPRHAQTGDLLRLTTAQGAPGLPVLLFLVEVNGTPRIQPLVTGLFDGSGIFNVAGTVPPGLANQDFVFWSIALSSTGQILDTARETIEFEP